MKHTEMITETNTGVHCTHCGQQTGHKSSIAALFDSDEEPLSPEVINAMPFSLRIKIQEGVRGKTRAEAVSFYNKLEEYLPTALEPDRGQPCYTSSITTDPSINRIEGVDETEVTFRELADPHREDVHLTVDDSPEAPELEFHHPRMELVSGKKNVLPFTDLTPYLEKTFQLELPSVAESYQGCFLFYEGRANAIQGDTGIGKTIALMASSISVLRTGGIVLFIDPEDRPEGFVSRMLALGADPKDMTERLKYLHDPTPEQMRAAQDWAQLNRPVLVIVDGLAETLASRDVDENSAQGFLTYYRAELHPFAKAGAAVVIVDHISKKSRNRVPHARGTGAKAGRYDGVSYEILPGTPFTPTRPGHIKFKIAKDRNGGVGARGDIAVELHLTPGAEGRTITEFKNPNHNSIPQKSSSLEKKTDFTLYKDRIMKLLSTRTTATKSEILELEGKDENLNKALNELIETGIVGVMKDGKKHIHFLIPVEEKADSHPSPIVSLISEGHDQPVPWNLLKIDEEIMQFPSDSSSFNPLTLTPCPSIPSP